MLLFLLPQGAFVIRLGTIISVDMVHGSMLVKADCLEATGGMLERVETKGIDVSNDCLSLNHISIRIKPNIPLQLPTSQ